MPTLNSITCWIGLLVFGISITVDGQNFGGVPPGKSWMIKGNDQIDVIYNEGAPGIADTVLSIVDWINENDPYSLGERRENVKIVLRNENLTTNGFVGYVPFRSEFYLYGAQNPNILGYNDWIRLLTLHEYRHVIQYSNMRWGVSRIARDIFGDAAQAGLFNLLVPDWFSEGDAVYFESMVTGNGRGQLPAFSADFRALLLADMKYSYGKFRNGSFRDRVPNQYVHGYLLTGFGYRKFSAQFWQDVMQQTSRLKGLILPFKKAVKRNSGLQLPDFHNAMLDEYQKYLYDRTDTSEMAGNNLLSPSHRIKNEIQILVDSTGQEYLLENSFDEISTVYKLIDGRRKKIFTLGRTNDPYLILRDSRIYFTNRQVDARWTNREYADIYYYDIQADKVHRVTRQKKYLSVDYQPATQRYLAVQAGVNGINTVVAFHGDDGVIDTLLNDPDTYYSYPHWVDEESEKFIFTGRKHGRMFLRMHDMSTEQTEDLIPPSRETISRPYVTESGIYFSSSLSGIDNIYFYNFTSKKISPVTYDKVGAYNPIVSIRHEGSIPGSGNDESAIKELPVESTRLYYSAKTAYGQRIQVVPISAEDDSVKSNRSVPEWEPLNVDRYTGGMVKGMLPVDTVHYTGNRYLPARHLIHFHSLYLEPSTSIPKLSLLSNDYLNTTKTSIYARFFNSDRSFELGGEMTYAAWYPELFLNVNHRLNRRLGIEVENDFFELPKSETSVNAGLSVPLDFSRRQFSHYLRFTGRYGWTQEHFDPDDPVLPGRINLEPRLFQTGLFNVDWTLQRLRAYRDIFPKWGVTGNLLAKKSFTPGESWLLYAQQGYYLPGLFRNDGFKLRWQFQHNSIMANNFLPYELKTTHDLNYDYENFHTGGLITFNYLFPLAYPEIAIPHVIYTKRISANVFTEHFRSNRQYNTWSGLDLFLTARYFNIFDFTAGIRISRNWDQESEPFTWSVVFMNDL